MVVLLSVSKRVVADGASALMTMAEAKNTNGDEQQLQLQNGEHISVAS
jgi:hypothetical protein